MTPDAPVRPDPRQSKLGETLEQAERRCRRLNFRRHFLRWGALASLGNSALTWALTADFGLVAAAGLVVPIGLVLRESVRRGRPLQRARQLDRALSSHALLANAWELSHEPRPTQPWTELLVDLSLERAAQLCERIELARALPTPPRPPVARPALAWALAGIACTVTGAWLSSARVPRDESSTAVPVESHKPASASPPQVEANLPPSLLLALQQRLDGFADHIDEASPEQQAAFEKARALVDALVRGELSQSEALAALEDLETALSLARTGLNEEGEGSTIERAAIDDALRTLAETLRRDPTTRALARAIQERDPAAIRRALQSGGEKPKDDAWSSSMRAAADALERRLKRERSEQAESPPGSSHANLEGRNERERRGPERLQRHPRTRDAQGQGDASQAKDERRLGRRGGDQRPGGAAGAGSGRGQRRQGQGQGQSREGLQRLARAARTAASTSTPGGDQARDELARRLDDSVRASRQGARDRALDEGARDLRRWLQESGNQGARKRIENFARRAGARRAPPADAANDRQRSALPSKDPADASKPGDIMIDTGRDDAQPSRSTSVQSESTTVVRSQRVSSTRAGGSGRGAGRGSDHRDASISKDDAKRSRAQLRSSTVAARESQGVTRAEIIQTASQAGFASEHYESVFRDYHEFAQSPVESERIPATRRDDVRQYFNLIAPRP